jgi:hypothetical protein
VLAEFEAQNVRELPSRPLGVVAGQMGGEKAMEAKP